MALTATQIVDIRYYMGYSVSGDTASAPYRELAYSDVSYMAFSLDYRLAHLSVEEETRVTGYFLVHLPLREAEIQGAAANLDTDKASVWTRNRSEVSDRRGVFNALRIDLCRFLGFAPGAGLPHSRLVRA